MSKKLIKMLQKAHAGEIGAYLAYQGHWESLKDPVERETLKWIQEEEFEHIQTIEIMLFMLGGHPSPWRDRVFAFIGNTLSKLCKLTGYALPMYGAILMEKVGVNSYEAMCKEAYKNHLYWHGQQLLRMAKTEEEHEVYLKTCLKQTRVFDQRNRS